MNRDRSFPEEPASVFRSEIGRLRALLDRWATSELNRLFALSIGGARRRTLQAAVFLLMLGIAAVGSQILLAGAHPLRVPEGTSSWTLVSGVPLYALRFVLILGIASSIAVRASGSFLADIFALRDESLGWRFIRGLAWGRTREVLHLRDGRIVESDQNSIMVRVGGPGRVVADSDTAALFERADGTPHAVGPTGRNPHAARESRSGVLVEGFERIREPIVDLRDQYIGSAGGEPMTVTGRSLDGMPVSVVDVRGVFSVRRDANAAQSESSDRRAFPLRPQDIESLIYRQTVPVLTSGDHPSGIPQDWTDAMQTLIRSSLREFMSQSRLTDFLAGIGSQEAEVSEFREDTILARSLEVANGITGAGAPATASKPSMRPRTELSARFKKYGSQFSTRAQQLGLELHWIGVGTWKIPEEASGTAVDAKHLEAWQMNRENAEHSDPRALERVAEEALLDAKLSLIQEVPISSHEQNQKRYSDRSVLTECMLQDLWRRLGDALDVLYRSGQVTPDLERLEEAVLKLENLLGIQPEGDLLGSGFVSRVRPRSSIPAKEDGPPAPASRGEAAKYRLLLGRLNGSYKVAEAMIANEARRHANLNREELMTRIIERFERHGR
jgi:hypothetical protein